MGRYERQESLNINREQAVAVIGVGGVGSWVVEFLCLAGVQRLELYDGDTVSDHNLNRLPLPPSTVGQLKTQALADALRGRDTEIVAHLKFDPEILLEPLICDWIVCCTDSLASRRMIWKYAKDNGIKYMEVGADGDGWTVTYQPPDRSTGEPDVYRQVPIHIAPCAMAASVAVMYVLKDKVPAHTICGGWDDSEGVIFTRFHV